MLIIELFKHYFQANTLHGTHSPYVYELYKAVFSKDDGNDLFKRIENQRRILKQDNTLIEFIDFGAKGSYEGTFSNKTVKSIAKHSLKSAKWGRALHRLASYLEVSEIIELGTSLGITTSYLASSFDDVTVTSFDGSVRVIEQAKKVWSNLELKNIESVVGNIDQRLPYYLQQKQKVELVFIDANHQESATKGYFEILLPLCNDKSVLIFDDIYWSKGMNNAWNYIKEHPKTQQTIDLYEIGIVLFRKNQEREHFKLRY